MVDAKKILIEMSNRHVHLSREHIDILFGKNYKLKLYRKLTQPGEFSAEEKISLIKDDKKIEEVRVVGPERKTPQVELLKSDAVLLGIEAPLRISGDIENTPGLIVEGPKGSLELKKGAIIAKNHLHASEGDADIIGLKNNQLVSIKIPGKEEIYIDDIVVRVDKNYKLCLHIDKELGNAHLIEKIAYGKLII